MQYEPNNTVLDNLKRMRKEVEDDPTFDISTIDNPANYMGDPQYQELIDILERSNNIINI